MATLLNPSYAAAYDQVGDEIALTLSADGDSWVVELDPAEAPKLINALMAAVHAAKVKPFSRLDFGRKAILRGVKLDALGRVCPTQRPPGVAGAVLA
jgi:hypothetical protein